MRMTAAVNASVGGAEPEADAIAMNPARNSTPVNRENSAQPAPILRPRTGTR